MSLHDSWLKIILILEFCVKLSMHFPCLYVSLQRIQTLLLFLKCFGEIDLQVF